LEAVFAKSVQSGTGYKTRSRKERIEDIEKMFADSAISAVFAIRGGYGAGELLDGIDYQLIKANPKIFAGFSDITALHLAFNKAADLITFHSPVLLSRFNEFTSSSFRKTLFSSEPIGILENPQLVSGARKIFPTRTIVSGSSDGILTGGNLTIISSLMGTPWEIDTENKILLLEDVGEEPYRIDRMLNQLRLAGKLNKARGIIFGSCTDCDRKSNIWDLSVGEVLDKYFKPLDCPSFYGLLFGHTENQLTIPMGGYASMNSDTGTITFNDIVTVK
jgi:muramoyltetrapeptide carboxypeptidase